MRRLFADDAPVTDENLRSPRAKRVAPGSPVKSVTPKKAPPKRRPNRFAVLGGVIFEEDKADQQRQSDVVSPITSDSDDDGYKDRNRPGVYPKKGKGRKLRRLPVKTRRPYVTVADYIAAKDANKEVGPSRQVDPAEEEQVVSQVGFGDEDEEEWDDSPGIQQSLNAAFEAAEAKEANQRATVMAPGSEETTAGTNANQAAVTLVSREKVSSVN